MSPALRQLVSRLLLLAFAFNALSPLIAAAQDRAGTHAVIVQLCTQQGFRAMVLDDGGKTLPRTQSHDCPFCVHGLNAALPFTATPLPAYVALSPQSPPAYSAPAPSRAHFALTPPLRGPPELA